MIVLNTHGTEGLVNLVIKCGTCNEAVNVNIAKDDLMMTVLLKCNKCGRRLVKWFVDDGKPETVTEGLDIAFWEWNSGKAGQDV